MVPVQSELGHSNIVLVGGEPSPLIRCPDVVASIPSFNPNHRRAAPTRYVLVRYQINESLVLLPGLRQANRCRERGPSGRFLPAREL